MTRREDGFAAEHVAAEHLVARGYRIVDRNYQVRSGELDLIAAAPDGTLCFVEVRSRAGVGFGRPSETVTHAKRRRLISAARHYLAMRVRGEPPCRFDVIEIVGGGAGRTIEHIADAFRLDDL